MWKESCCSDFGSALVSALTTSWGHTSPAKICELRFYSTPSRIFLALSDAVSRGEHQLLARSNLRQQRKVFPKQAGHRQIPDKGHLQQLYLPVGKAFLWKNVTNVENGVNLLLSRRDSLYWLPRQHFDQETRCVYTMTPPPQQSQRQANLAHV